MAERLFPAGSFPTPDHPILLDDHQLRSTTDLERVIDHLAHYVSDDPAQADVRDSMLEFARSHPDALERTCVPGHFTASALVVERGTDRFVVLHHTKLSRWLQPGGHVDGSSNMPASALREAAEETGIGGLAVALPVVDLDIHRVAPPAEAPHDHLDLRFLVLAPNGSEPVGNHESTAIRWVTVADLDDLGADDGLRRLAAAGLTMARRLGA